ncbi:MAG: M18 family aminopeptidase [Anaerorhabdus sp.]
MKTEKLVQFLNQAVTSYHTVQEIEKRLQEEGYEEKKEVAKWELRKGKKYYVKRNESSIIAFSIGSKLDQWSFNIVSSHSDVPAFKLKPNCQISKDGAVQLNTEVYGGPLYSTWFDRLLSVAGKVVVRDKKGLHSKLVCLKEPVGIIPNVAIHLNREANTGLKYNEQVDLLPFVSLNREFNFMDYFAKEIGVKAKDIIDSELYLYPVDKAKVWGSENEFISSYHLDDAQCAYATLEGFLKGKNKNTIGVYCCFDNEEVGSGTRQGAASTLLCDVLDRIQEALKISDEQMMQAKASSLMISADNAHAYHPNHPEKLDPTNVCHLNKGVVVKYSAQKRYATDAVSAAIFKELCAAKKVDVQLVSNRSDVAGGSTLGPISTRTLSIPTIDIGLAQLAMHSAYETAGVHDTKMMIDVVEEFFNTQLILDDEHFEMRKED